MSDMYLGSQAPLYQNVCITKRSKNGKILDQRFAKNRITRLMLYGIAKFLMGHYNDSTPEKIYEVIPRYLALGTNVPLVGNNSNEITTSSSVNDSRLLNEIKYSSTISGKEKINRIKIVERNMCKINTKFTDPYIKVSIKTFIAEDAYDGFAIGEAGLFSKEKDNNCLARVCFNPITKNQGEVLEIQWDITLLSYGETKYPSSLTLTNGNNLIIPLYYLGKKFIEISTGFKINNGKLFHDNIKGSILLLNNNNKYEIELTNDFTSNLATNTIKDYMINNNEICKSINESQLDYIVNMLKTHLNESIYDKNDNNLYKYLNDDVKMYTPCYINSFIDPAINDNQIRMLLMFEESELINKVNEPIANMSLISENSLDYYIYTVKGINTDDINSSFDRDWLEDEFDYRIFDNRIYKNTNITLNRLEKPSWSPTDYFLEAGFIIDINGERIKIVELDELNTVNSYEIYDKLNSKHDKLSAYYVTYNGEYIYLSEVAMANSYSYQFISKDSSNYSELQKYLRINKEMNGLIMQSEYILDHNNDNVIKEIMTSNGSNININETMYHLDNNYYWVMSNYEKLVYSILPSDTTDKSITWNVQNKDIAKINTDGVITSWNVGDTMVVGKTVNDISVRCNVSVIKESKFITSDSITINPKDIVFYTEDINTEYIVEATIKPIYSSITTVSWALDSSIRNCINLIDLGNNRVKLILNESGNIGSGFLIATDQSGKSDSCLITVIIGSNNSNDCPNDYHLHQEA